MCCVLGTLGRFCIASSLPFTVQLAATSFTFRLLVRVDDFFLLSGLVCAGAAGTAWPSAMPLEPSAGLEGFEEDHLLWWHWYESAVAHGIAVEREDMIGIGGVVKAARHIEDENMPSLPRHAEAVS